MESVDFSNQPVHEREVADFKQKLEWIKSLNASLKDKINLLLLIKGLKSVCIIEDEIDASQVGLFSKSVTLETKMNPTKEQIEYLKSLGVITPEPKEFEKSVKMTDTYVSTRQEDLEKILQLQEEKRQSTGVKNLMSPIDYEIGKLFGYPESCLAKFDLATDSKVKVPDHLQSLKSFTFSPDHWQEELKFLESWYEQIKDLIPQIKQDSTETF